MSSVTIKNVRFSYVYVFEPSKMSGKYSARVLVPKDNTEALNALKEAIEECKRNPKSLDTWKNGGKVPGNLTVFLRDGDVVGVGRAVLEGEEMKKAEKGVAVRIRHRIKS